MRTCLAALGPMRFAPPFLGSAAELCRRIAARYDPGTYDPARAVARLLAPVTPLSLR